MSCQNPVSSVRPEQKADITEKIDAATRGRVLPQDRHLSNRCVGSGSARVCGGVAERAPCVLAPALPLFENHGNNLNNNNNNDHITQIIMY